MSEDITPEWLKVACKNCGHEALDHVFGEGPCKPYVKVKPNGCESKCPRFVPPKCLHNKHNTITAKLVYIEDCQRYMLEVSARCDVCARPFRFLNLPGGFHFEQATVDIGGKKVNLPVHPVGEEPPPLPLKGPSGFSVKVTS